MRIRGATGQTADLQQWSDVSGNLKVGITKDGWVQIASATAPASNSAVGGYLYVESGALKYRGSSGTITTLGAA